MIMKTYIWTLPTRLFHWLLAISCTSAYLLGEVENSLNLHAAFGSMALCLVIFRLVQGASGPKYARFRDFPVSFSSLKSFFTGFRHAGTLFPGHNPPAAVVMLAILLMVIVSALSGMMIVAAGADGFLGIRINAGADSEILLEIHEVVVNVLLGLVCLHLAGLLSDLLLHSYAGTIGSMFTGYKKIPAQDAGSSGFHRVFSVFWIVVPALVFFYVWKSQPMMNGGKQETEQTNETEEEE
jgi:cytochrome b